MNVRMVIIGIVLNFIFFCSADLPVNAQTVAVPKYIQTIDTSIWDPPSPDPAGIVYWSEIGEFIVSDSEVNEMPNYFQGSNVFQMSSAGSLNNTFSTTSYSNEPTDIALDSDGRRIFISDDDQKKIFEISFGADDIFGTGDDVVRNFSTSAFGLRTLKA